MRTLDLARRQLILQAFCMGDALGEPLQHVLVRLPRHSPLLLCLRPSLPRLCLGGIHLRREPLGLLRVLLLLVRHFLLQLRHNQQQPPVFLLKLGVGLLHALVVEYPLQQGELGLQLVCPHSQRISLGAQPLHLGVQITAQAGRHGRLAAVLVLEQLVPQGFDRLLLLLAARAFQVGPLERRDAKLRAPRRPAVAEPLRPRGAHAAAGGGGARVRRRVSQDAAHRGLVRGRRLGLGDPAAAAPAREAAVALSLRRRPAQAGAGAARRGREVRVAGGRPARRRQVARGRPPHTLHFRHAASGPLTPVGPGAMAAAAGTARRARAARG